MSNDISMQNQKNYSLGMTEIEARQLAEIKGKMVLAKQFPRDPNESLQRIITECQNIKLAEVATYSFPRGDSEVKGPSIRLAEVIASHWGNFTCGVTELEQRTGESTVKAYAWDLETNYSDEKVFTVPHVRSTRKGNSQLTDPRDIYELVANQGARRKRACIFSVIPAYLVETATEECQRVLEDSMNKEGLEAVRVKMLSVFQALDENITREVMETKIGKPFDTFNSKDIVKLRNLYNAIKDGFVKVSVAFDLGKSPDEPTLGEDDAAKMDEVKNIFDGSPFDPNAPEEANESDSEILENKNDNTNSDSGSDGLSDVHSKEKSKKDKQVRGKEKDRPTKPTDSEPENDDDVPEFVKESEAEEARNGTDAE